MSVEVVKPSCVVLSKAEMRGVKRDLARYSERVRTLLLNPKP